MAKKTFTGKIVSDKMQNTVVVEITRKVMHPIYKKTLKKSGRIKADTAGLSVHAGQTVVIEQAKPMSRDKHFKVLKIVEEKE